MDFKPGDIIIMNEAAPHSITIGGSFWKIAEDQYDPRKNIIVINSIPGFSPANWSGFSVDKRYVSLYNMTKLERILWEI